MSALLLPEYDALNWHARWRVEKFDCADFATLRGRRHGLLDLFTPRGHRREPQRAEIVAAGIKPYETIDQEGNLLCNNGINRLLNLLIGTASIASYVNGKGRVGTGNGTTAAAASDTDLSAAAGSTNRWFQAADTSNPSVSAQTMTMIATFASADGNYAWNEWGIDGGGTSGNTVGTNSATNCALLNRKVPASSLGTKASGASWAFTTTITIS